MMKTLPADVVPLISCTFGQPVSNDKAHMLQLKLSSSLRLPYASSLERMTPGSGQRGRVTYRVETGAAGVGALHVTVRPAVEVQVYQDREAKVANPKRRKRKLLVGAKNYSPGTEIYRPAR